MVDWCYLGGVRFNEPFFQDSIVRALRRPFSAAFLRRTPLKHGMLTRGPIRRA